MAAAIRGRKTFKVMGSADDAAAFSPAAVETNRQRVLESLRVAGWAPFHFFRGDGGLAEPWRAHVLWHPECQRLAGKMRDWFPEMTPSNKLPNMMYACGALVVVTWVPQFYHLEERKDSQVTTDEEHLAASSAMVQNLLLMLTAHGMGTYWSSGGQLRSPEAFERLGIPPKERLLAAVFVEFPETLGEARERIAGRHRERRSDRWIREVAELTEPD
ncbi:MAG: nitroreductase family protein [Acidobacteriota bacterium]